MQKPNGTGAKTQQAQLIRASKAMYLELGKRIHQVVQILRSGAGVAPSPASSKAEITRDKGPIRCTRVDTAKRTGRQEPSEVQRPSRFASLRFSTYSAAPFSTTALSNSPSKLCTVGRAAAGPDPRFCRCPEKTNEPAGDSIGTDPGSQVGSAERCKPIKQ